LDFEVDSYKNLRLIAGVNPFASEYLCIQIKFLRPFIYVLSNNGTGKPVETSMIGQNIESFR
jgi:alpha-galactosidase